MDDKARLRDEAKAIRAAIPLADRTKKSTAIFSNLIGLPAFKEANGVFTFVSFRDEVQTKAIIEYLWEQDKRVYIPYIQEKGNEMRASELKSYTELTAGYFGVLEQREDAVRITATDNIDLVITPGLLFDVAGYRVGYGGGYFDRFFSTFNTPVTKIGICFSEQIRPSVPRDSFDIPVDWIVTDKDVYETKKHIAGESL